MGGIGEVSRGCYIDEIADEKQGTLGVLAELLRKLEEKRLVVIHAWVVGVRLGVGDGGQRLPRNPLIATLADVVAHGPVCGLDVSICVPMPLMQLAICPSHQYAAAE